MTMTYCFFLFFFFNDTATTEIYTLSLHDALPISMRENLEKVKLLACDLRNGKEFPRSPRETLGGYVLAARAVDKCRAVRSEEHTSELQSPCNLVCRLLLEKKKKKIIK